MDGPAQKDDGDLIVVLCTFPSADAAGDAAYALVGERLCACVNILPPMRSVYPWQGQIENSAEVLCLIKTTWGRYAQLAERIAQLHPYEVPEIVALPACAVSQSYLEWVRTETRSVER